MSGWFAVKRGITAHPIFKGNPERLAVWLWLLDNAAWKDTPHDIKGKTVTVKRGQVCASERRIASEVGVGRQVVRTFLDRLKTEGMINPDPTHGRTIITLCNYEKYQSPQPTGNPQSNPPVTQDQPTKEQGNNLTREEEPYGSLSSGTTAAPEAALLDEVAEAVAAYNATASEAGWPRVKSLNKQRRASLKARLSEAGGIEGWNVALAKARASPLCNGANNRGWVANFDFLTQSSSFTRLMEGNYDGRLGNHSAAPRVQDTRPSAGQSGMLGAFARREAARGH